MSEIRRRLLNSWRATWLALPSTLRHAVTVRSTSLKRASMSSVSLYLSTVILSREPVESRGRHPDRQANATLPYMQLHISRVSTARFLQACASAWYQRHVPAFDHQSVLVGEVLQYLSPREDGVYVDC